MLLAELDIRHTRRHMPTRRVALGDSYLPTSGAAHGAVLLGAVVAEFVGALDEDSLELLPRLLADARHGLSVPRIALRYRLQTDRHGLDRSRHRIVRDETAFALPILELDVHGRSVPQVLGSVLAAASLPTSGRRVALRAIEHAIDHPGVLPGGYRIVRLHEGVPGGPPLSMPGVADGMQAGDAPMADGWAGLPSERRWAMEVLGIRPPGPADRQEIQRRFRRLLRNAHPDQGGALGGAAERIAELSEARELLLAALTAAAEPAGG